MYVPFFGQSSNTVAMTVGAASANVQVVPTGTTGIWQAKVYNSGTAVCFIASGGNSVSTTIPAAGGANGGQPIAPGAVEVLTFSGTYIAAIGTSGTLYITPGSGI